ncbi:MAG: gliding motility-associated-like protein [Cryomorphaceae bacterium]
MSTRPTKLNLRKREILLIVFMLLLALSSSAQVVIDRQVIGSSGGSFSLGGNIIMEQTVGESVISTIGNNGLILTQGFHQPLTEGFLSIAVATTPSSCPTSSDGSAYISEITGCTPPYEIVWSNGIVEIDSLDRLLPGLYSVTVFSGFCQETVEFEVLPGPASNCVLRIFNAFTPDGDGKSDTWTMENIDLEEFKQNKVEIFNRWGQQVFSARNYNNDDVVWNGESESGTELLSGTYFYVVEAGGITFKGYIELIR